MNNIHFLTVLLIFNFFSNYSQTDDYPLEALIGKSYCKKCYSENNYLNEEVFLAFDKMKTEALKAGIEIQIVSGNRNYNRQKAIFDRKYNLYKSKGLSQEKVLQKIIEYSTIPGTSRHHWGTDIDIIQKNKRLPKKLLTVKNYEANGVFCELKEWMDKNGHKFGFYLVYTNDKNRTGFKYEPWHYSYAPISKKILFEFLKLHDQKKVYPNIKYNSIIDEPFFNNYIINNILGINYELNKS